MKVFANEGFRTFRLLATLSLLSGCSSSPTMQNGRGGIAAAQEVQHLPFTSTCGATTVGRPLKGLNKDALLGHSLAEVRQIAGEPYRVLDRDGKTAFVFVDAKFQGVPGNGSFCGIAFRFVAISGQIYSTTAQILVGWPDLDRFLAEPFPPYN